MLADREELLRLMHGAPGRFTTARTTVREWRDEETADEVRERVSASEAYRRIFSLPSEPGPPTRGDEFERIWRVWHERPNRWRQEVEPTRDDGPGTEYRVVDGREFWYYSPRHGARHAVTAGQGFAPEFEIGYLFDPEEGAPDLYYLSMRAVGRARQAGREAIRVEATKPRGWDYPPEPLWWGADDYELVVDAERGVILRLASRLRGRAFDVTEVLDIHFDETFPEGTFSLQLPGVRFDVTDYLT